MYMHNMYMSVVYLFVSDREITRSVYFEDFVMMVCYNVYLVNIIIILIPQFELVYACVCTHIVRFLLKNTIKINPAM